MFIIRFFKVLELKNVGSCMCAFCISDIQTRQINIHLIVNYLSLQNI